MWEMWGIGGQSIVEGSDSGTSATRRPLDYFMDALPHGHFVKMVQWTSAVLPDKRKRGVSTGELLKFLGILILGTRYHFGKRRELWTVDERNRFLSAPCFGTKTGIPATDLRTSGPPWCSRDRVSAQRMSYQRSTGGGYLTILLRQSTTIGPQTSCHPTSSALKRA